MAYSNKNILKMSVQQTLRFLEYYKQEEVLWNTKLEKYRDKNARVEATERIAKVMNMEEFGPDQVIIKFKNLRSSYCQELKKIARSEKLKASKELKYVPLVVWFSKMDSFLRPFVTSRSIQSSLVTDSEDAEISENEIEFSPVNKKRKVIPPPRREKEPSTINSSYAPPLQSETNSDKAHQQRGDSFDQFGNYMASLLREMPRQKAYLLQQQMISLALNAKVELESLTVMATFNNSGSGQDLSS